jgi:hypothetical protein
MPSGGHLLPIRRVEHLHRSLESSLRNHFRCGRAIARTGRSLKTLLHRLQMRLHHRDLLVVSGHSYAGGIQPARRSAKGGSTAHQEKTQTSTHAATNQIVHSVILTEGSHGTRPCREPHAAEIGS